MRIRKLEMQGFKSFADRASFHFGLGISGVVGPNGCGKSNVVDAVRWCIGEQSAKSLRGDAMSDVIFAGSATRGAVSFAEVGLTFVATDEPFPGIWQRFAEIEVTRRLYRDGTSEYLINQEKVRLRDIQDLFMDTGVGNRLYSFIEQGRIGQIVQARPEQRRTLIEEAAGISRYKQRREEAMEKLGTTRASLERVADLTEEMARQLRSVERQVQRSLKARSVGARVRQEELAVALGRFGALVADRKALGERLRAAEAELDEATRGVTRLEEELERRRVSFEALDTEANRARDRLAEVEAQRRVEESAAVYQGREQAQITERLGRLGTDQEEQRTERDAAVAEQAARESAQREAEAALHSARARLEVASERLKAAHQENTIARERLEAAKNAATAALGAAVRAQGARAGIGARRQEIEARTARNRAAAAAIVPGRVTEELERQKAAVATAERSLAELRSRGTQEIEALKAEVDARTAAVRARVEAETATVRGQGQASVTAVRTEVQEAVTAVRREGELRVAAARAEGEAAVAQVRTSVEAQLGTLRSALAEADARAVAEAQRRAEAQKLLAAAETKQRELLREQERTKARIDALVDMDRRHVDAPDGVRRALAVPGVVGTLSDEVQVRAELEAPLARALDGGLDAVLVPDAAAAAQVVAAAKGSRVRVLIVGEGAPTGLAAEVDASPVGKRALAALLPDVRVVDDLAEAVRGWRPGAWFASPDGVIRGDGLVILGGETGAGVAALQRRREVATLTAQLEAMPVDAVRAEVEAARAAVGDDQAERGAVEAARARLREGEDAGRGAVNTAADHARGLLNAALEAQRQADTEAQESGRRRVVAAEDQAKRALDTALDRARAVVTDATDAARAHLDALTLRNRQAVQQEESLLAEARHRLREADAERIRVERAVTAVAQEDAAIAAAIQAVAADEARVGDEIRRAESEQMRAEEAVRGEQVVLERVEPVLAAAESEVQGLRVEVQVQQRDALSNQEASASARARAERAELRVGQIAQERTDLERRRDEVALEALASADRLQALGEEQGRVHVELEGLKERVRDEKERLRVVETNARAARDRRDTARDRHVAAESRLGEVRSALDRLREETDGRHTSSLPAMLDRLDRDGQLLVEGYEPDEGALELGAEPVPTLRITREVLRAEEAELVERGRALQALRDQLGRLGEYSPEAEDEYRDVAARHRDLEVQRADLVEAVDIIEKAVAKINKTCRERFRETFDLVNEQFQQLYPRLVGGGSSRLELTDEEDMLTAGVEMLVQPPGKRVQNLTLLSGGEKAMAALGLIFALFRIKPSPFCLLDEVDAPLDEGNGARFNDMLRDMSTRSQFIVITHNKKTMECADVLYGVTMPEPGTSRLVTVKLE